MINLMINLKNSRLVKKEPRGIISEELFQKYFYFQMPTAMFKYLYNLNNRNKNNKLVDVIKSGLIDLENEI